MLDYAKERWLKMYTRDTGTWCLLRWQTRGLILELSRKVDEDGVIHAGKGGLVTIARMLGGDYEEMAPFLTEALDAGKLVWNEDAGELLVDGHKERQAARTSDAERQRKSRAARAAREDEGRGAALRHTTSQVSQQSHAPPPAVTRVTPCHDQIRREEKRSEERREGDAAERTLPLALPTRCPADLTLTPEARAYAETLTLTDVELVWEKFVAHFSGGQGSGRQALDWYAEWRKWVANEVPRQRTARELARARAPAREMVQPAVADRAWKVGGSA
jgi:hypothetical protein